MVGYVVVKGLNGLPFPVNDLYTKILGWGLGDLVLETPSLDTYTYMLCGQGV